MKTLALAAVVVAAVGSVGCNEHVDGGAPAPTASSSGASGDTGGGPGSGGHDPGAGGSSAEGGAAAACSVAQGRIGIEVGALGICLSHSGGTPSDSSIDGTYAATASGFVISAGEAAVTIDGDTPAIPDGTFVHMTYGCNPGFYGDSGGYVMIENEPTLAGTPNPIEDGTRLWYFAAVGGEARVPDAFPFAMDEMEACRDGDIDTGFTAYERVNLSGPGFSAWAEPGGDATFSATEAPEVGAYRLENVYVTFVGYPGGDATSNVNFRVTRAD